MTGPVVVRTRQELHDHLAGVRAAGGRVALVPTMGALHEGHATLAREARAMLGPDPATGAAGAAGAAGVVVVSVFVNPLQFGVGEDLDRYPRTFDADLEVCAREGVDVVFAPAAEEVYPGGEPEVTLDPGPLGTVLEGAVRPTHFRGVLTVVAKLFGLVRPDLAVFGEKDYQQLVLIRRMAADLCLGVDVVGVPTVREPDGLALSSRNRYLTADDRQVALALSTALRAGAGAAAAGAGAVLTAAQEALAEHPEVAVDYLALTAPDLHDPPASGPARLLVAARVGTTRLIDNLALDLAEAGSRTTEGAR